jgi:hypothetical protein
VIPPLVVLSTAYILKGQLLDTIEQRHASERAYQVALAEWQAAAAEPERHPQWSQWYANALQDALRRVNVRRRDILAMMDQEDWRQAVYREMKADLWYEDPALDEQAERTMLSISELSPLRRNGGDVRPKVIAAVGGAV